MPVFLMISRMSDLASGSSAQRSARMSRAPARAAASSGTALSLSSLMTMYCLRVVCGSSLLSQMRSARGSRPRSIAMVARVRRLGLKGAKTSSRRVMVSAALTFFLRSSVRSLRSSRLLMMAVRRRSRSPSC